jgi:hypothetical protein
LHIVEASQALAALEFIGKDVGNKFNLPEIICLAAEKAFKKDHRAFRRIPIGTIQIPEANRNHLRGAPATLHRVRQKAIRKQQMKIPAVGPRDHRDALRQAGEQGVFAIPFAVRAYIEISEFGLQWHQDVIQHSTPRM